MQLFSHISDIYNIRYHFSLVPLNSFFLVFGCGCNDRGSPPTSSTSSSSLTNDVAKQPVSRDLPPGRPGATGPVGVQYTPHSHQFPRTRKMFDKGPDQVQMWL